MRSQILNRLFSLFFALIWALPAQAGATATLSAEQIGLEFKSFEKPTLLTGRFTQVKTINELDISLATEGEFRIKRISNEKVSVLWRIEKPDPMRICIDEETILLDNLRTKKQTRLKLRELSEQDSSGLTKLVHLLKLHPVTLAADFNISKNSPVFTVRPKNKINYQFAVAKIELDPKKNIKKIELAENNGDTLQIAFLKTQEKALTPADAQKQDCR